MNRRTFSNNLLSISTGVLCVPKAIWSYENVAGRLEKIPKTDTHVHLFDLKNLSYGWLKNSPKINRNFDLQDYKEATKSSNIGKMVFMESGTDAHLGLKEATLVSQLALSEPKIRGIVAKADLTQGPGTEKALEQLCELPLVKGIRAGFPKNAATSNGFLEGFKALADRKLSFDLLISPPLMAEAAKVAIKFPDTIFILDHLGNPNVGDADTTQWRNGIEKLAELPNVNCKISGIITRFGKDWSVEKIKPYILYVIEKFGMDRLVYAGDWPVVLLADSYKRWSRAFEKITEQFSDEELHKIYHKNADHIYRL
ncbi:L-fuconolactonase [Larkinella arboricola]|uniref:L-fuconolactonase n=1 Tax=Larkinella arboricola TaxID=643671 RepID=A0A327WHY9_LARAB|nr:amidohydrolase family protein [Larkinella arboricola]RAJ91008.1 L-fuconolactonase [Larkinella arboricola]